MTDHDSKSGDWQLKVLRCRFWVQGSLSSKLRQFPSITALGAYGLGRYSIWAGLCVLCILFCRVPKWMTSCVLGVMVLACVQSHTLQQKQQWWQELSLQMGFLNVEVEWESDVYHSKSNKLAGWATVTPLLKGEPQHMWRRKAFVSCQTEGSHAGANTSAWGDAEPQASRMKGYRWQAKMAMKGQDDVIFMEVTPPKHGTLSWFSRMRFKVIHHLERHWKALPERERGLLRSLVTGYRAEFSSSDRHHFLRLGLPALLAISGLHLALVYGCAWWLCRAVGVGHFSILRYVPLGLALAYGCLGGWSIPLFRAAMMLMMTHACTLIGRRPSGMQMLSLCALLELMVHPEHMESLSFALSYLGVMGIYSVFRMWPSRPEGRLQRILKGMSISWGAMAWTWPMVLMTFETIPTWAWLLSPLFFATFAGVMFWVFGLVLLSMFGECPAWLMWPFELYLDGIALLSHHQAWVIRTEAGQVYWMMVYYVSLGLWCLSFPKKKVQLWSAEPFKN